ncbi:similar to Saccharomyces cerevisiae YBR094W PBY1 Putative tubulin tyrosine ligase associated with P-bodies [Maudiozyma barnettii]|uniref:Similar to Saccharomyces cerevisiae YBR094W PBY1 Putative tubulin tyrosine ligase associated with P-bodies n=1 Tax=Maudiozyma barnettii TaxID=61262 RepID=A0A8H2ZJK6_9SACH|nr:putative tubulin tyrosine ligase [Kazachstania barnettii]CAB4256637.1 similar to Saccharomyces cerevisiae YBR094W PBY1 Putative tubulin tyrosine ligase associated with P-bodies [Kazachstania barnettii]CAD1785240.1 similar to Saccharomyces cerevisiae YBR094W PBY1 Putative tubulin tyrosine ligase associated with P-bodies [Kazachstania barnettii]
MRILITNDDGPLNDDCSPYIRPFIQHIRRAHPHWKITVCVPHVQRSWNGKAHLAGKDLTATFIYSDIEKDDNSFWGPFNKPQLLQSKDSKLPYIINPEIPSDSIEWILVNGTPASCANIALHLLKDTKFDLVISGPNVGRNSSAAYITSSATVGAAMESVITGDTKAIAVSWAYYDNRKIVPSKLMKMASIRTTQIISHLWENWDPQTDIYSINVPLVDELSGSTKIFYAPIWENRWTAIFNGPHVREPIKGNLIEDGNDTDQISFNWCPDFKNHKNSSHYDGLVDSDQIAPGTDMDIIERRNISVTPLRATFRSMEHLNGELITKSNNTIVDEETVAIDNSTNDFVAALTISRDEYIYEPIKNAFKKYLPLYTIQSRLPDNFSSMKKLIQYGDYEQLDVDKLMLENSKYFANSYIYRKALIRKHYLAHTIHSYTVKHPESILNKAVLESHTLDLDYAEFLDDSLDENWELRQELENEKKWWIVKPSMSDKGQGIRVFKTIDDLQKIFDSFDDEANDDSAEFMDDNKIIISQLRHFIVQEYLTTPLLLPSMDNKKFHIRCYITCKGDLEVFVYNRMLALFAPTKYNDVTKETEFDPTDLKKLQSHLTNTCLQSKNETKELSVMEFDNLNDISNDNKRKIIKQIHEISHDVFLAAVTVNRMNFQPLPNAFETYGVDFLVDSNYEVKLLEINAYPDFKQTGDELKSLIDELFLNITKSVIRPLLDSDQTEDCDAEIFTKVLEHKSNEWN